MSSASDYLAKEAQRLSDDGIFNAALDLIRSEALDELSRTDAENTIAILRLQQRVAVVNDIRATLSRYVLAGERHAQDGASPFA